MRGHRSAAVAAVGAPAQARRTRGRPREISEAERRRRLIAASERIFLEQGYGAAGMDQVARRAGMSKKTLYQLFSTKEALFTAVIADRMASLITVYEDEQDDRPARAVLEGYLRQLAQILLSPRTMALHRVLIAEAWRTPELARTFHRECPARGKATLVRWLTNLGAQEGLAIEDPEEAAGMLFGMAIGELHIKLLTGGMRPPSKAEITRRVRRAVDIFLRGTAAH